jgi:hypothetical protein
METEGDRHEDGIKIGIRIENGHKIPHRDRAQGMEVRVRIK